MKESNTLASNAAKTVLGKLGRAVPSSGKIMFILKCTKIQVLDIIDNVFWENGTRLLCDSCRTWAYSILVQKLDAHKEGESPGPYIHLVKGPVCVLPGFI